MAVIIVMSISYLSLMGNQIDSLYRAYLNANDSRRIELVNTASQVLFDKGVIDVLYRLDKSETPEMVDAAMHYLRAEHLFVLKEYESSMEECEKAVGLIGKKENRLFSDALRVMGRAQFRLGKYDDALETMLDAHAIAEKLGDKELISYELSILAKVFLALEEASPGIQRIEKSIAIERQLNRPEPLANRLGIASELYLLNNEPEKALKAIDEALELDRVANSTERTATTLVQKGSVLEKMSRPVEASKLIQQALPVLEDAGNDQTLAIAFNTLAHICHDEGNINDATAYYKKALEHSIKSKSGKCERMAERGLWMTMRKENPVQAMMHLERYTALTDSLIKTTISVKNHIFAITDQYYKRAELNDDNSRLSRLLKWGIIGLGALLAVLLAGLFIAWRTTAKTLRLQRQTQSQRDIFLKNITQELHTPLSVIMGAGQQLLERGKTTTDDKQRIGNMIVSHSKNILRQVNNLIDIDKVDSSQEQPASKCGDIMLFVRLLVENFSDQAYQRHIKLEFTSPMRSLTVTFIPDFLRRIVHNLVSNAMNFTPSDGTITVSLEPLESDKMRLIVKDTGKGIPPEEVNRIFEPFYQSQNGDHGVDTALDLSLVNHIVKSMRGTIDVQTALGQGTSFTIDFPVQTSNQSNPETVSEAQNIAEERIRLNSDTRNRQLVFIVEDNEDVAFFTASHLKEDYNLRFAHDGSEAYQNALGLVPDLIITDTMMPIMDGKELIRQLRANTSLKHIPIIAITSSTSEQERLSCFEVGADAVLVKPVNSSELRLLVSRLIAQQRATRDHFAQTSGNSIQDEETSQMSKEDKDFINHLVDVIHAQMDKEDIDIEHIAAALSLSRHQLRNRLASITGLTPVAFVLQVRLNYAKHIISSDNSSLTSIANRCGFQNLSYFSKAFKRQFGVSPQQYRKDMGSMQRPTAKK